MESMMSTNYMSKPLNNSSSYNETDSSSSDDEQESSWGFYLDRFKSSCPPRRNETETETKTDSFFSGSLSVASFTVTDPLQERVCERSTRAKKRRRRTDFSFVDHDDDLEDTASSPDHTPKMNKFSFFQKPNLFRDLVDEQQQDGGYCVASSLELGGVNLAEEKGSDDNRAELRRKGLCLVPVSMFLHY